MNEGLFTNREIASLFWLGVMLAGLLLTRRTRSNTFGLIGTAISLFRFWFVWAFVGLILGILVPASMLGLWEPGLWKTTVLWLLLAGFGLFSKFTDAIEEEGFFKRATLRSVGVLAAVEFVANFASFSLWIEVPVQPMLFISILLSEWPSKNHQQAQAAKLASGFLATYGLAALGWAAWQLVNGWTVIDQRALAREFLLPVWLTAVALIYVYLLAAYSTYQSTFKQMRSAANGRPVCSRFLAVVLRTGGHLNRLRILDKAGGQRFARTSEFKDAWNEVGQIIVDDRERIAAEEAAERRLIENAGVTGVDSDRKQLDQREHAETKKALQWLADRQVGEYRRTGRYLERVQVLADNLSEQFGLPVPTGIRVHISSNGQRWYAERQTIAGHWFAIGAAGPPSDIWFYDGPQPPSGYPDNSEWDQWLGDNHAVNWG
ncbi:hypothetical protein [Candidatus Poriferisocius sp.]|uniref:hypothetical protein n=1 Tax=Candidatus Poriferisocius sp. TaxID=3101276 RepID=UPI003B02151B